MCAFERGDKGKPLSLIDLLVRAVKGYDLILPKTPPTAGRFNPILSNRIGSGRTRSKAIRFDQIQSNRMGLIQMCQRAGGGGRICLIHMLVHIHIHSHIRLPACLPAARTTSSSKPSTKSIGTRSRAMEKQRLPTLSIIWATFGTANSNLGHIHSRFTALHELARFSACPLASPCRRVVSPPPEVISYLSGREIRLGALAGPPELARLTGWLAGWLAVCSKGLICQ